MGTATVIPTMSEASEALSQVISDELVADLVRVAQKEMAIRSRNFGVFAESSFGGKSAEDFVSEAITRVLDDDGYYVWDPTRNSDIRVFLRVVIRGLVKNHFGLKATKTEICLPEEDGEEYQPTPQVLQDTRNPREVLSEKRRRETDDALQNTILGLVEDDELLTDVVLAILDGITKPKEIAAVLGVSPDEVYSAKKNLKRRLEKANVASTGGGDQKRDE